MLQEALAIRERSQSKLHNTISTYFQMPLFLIIYYLFYVSFFQEPIPAWPLLHFVKALLVCTYNTGEGHNNVD